VLNVAADFNGQLQVRVSACIALVTSQDSLVPRSLLHGTFAIACFRNPSRESSQAKRRSDFWSPDASIRVVVDMSRK
jgi:hypothetical protein